MANVESFATACANSWRASWFRSCSERSRPRRKSDLASSEEVVIGILDSLATSPVAVAVAGESAEAALSPDSFGAHAVRTDTKPRAASPPGAGVRVYRICTPADIHRRQEDRDERSCGPELRWRAYSMRWAAPRCKRASAQ